MIYSTINSYAWLGEPSSTMFRKSDIAKVGQFDTTKYQFIDLDLWIRLLTIGDCFVIPEELANVRTHGAQITRTTMKSYRFTFEDYELYRDLRDGKGYTIDVTNMNIDDAVRKKAVSCSKAMYKMVGKLHQREGRKTFKKAFSIAKEEQVLFTPLFEMIKRKMATKKAVSPTSL